MAKKTIKLTEAELRDVIKVGIKKALLDAGAINEESIMCEMATVGKLQSDGVEYTISVHGNISSDRQTSPHAHAVTITKIKGKQCEFNLEFSLMDILTQDKLTILCLRIGNKRQMERTDDWRPYNNLKKDIGTFLQKGPQRFFGNQLINNLHVIIWQLNNEYDYSKTQQGINVMREYLQQKGLTPLPKYSPLLEDIPTLRG